MRCKIRSLLIGLSSTTNTCTSRYCSVVRLSAAGRGWGLPFPELVYRNTRPLARTIRPPAPRVIQNTVHQTVIHLHQTTRRYTLSRLSAVGTGRGAAVLLVRQAAVQPVRDGAVDASRPALAARRLLRLLSAESARQTLRPFYQKLFRELLARELEEHRSRPAQSLLLARRVLGRRTLDSFILHSFIYRRHVCRVRQDGERYFFHRSAGPRQALPGNLPHPAEERGASLSVRLFFHTYDSPSSFTDVRADIGPIRAFLSAPSGQGGASTPKMTFAWGTLTHTGTLESFHVSYQMFAHDGTPVQAEVSISIRGEDPDVTAESANRAAESESEGEDDSSLWDDISWLFQ